jgi:arginase family enzyme
MNLCAEGGMDLGATDRLVDLGDLSLQAGAGARDQIEAAVSAIVDRDACALSLGGDHAVTYPIVKVYGRKYPNLNILHLDAHPDLYDDYEGNRYSNACPFARIMEEEEGKGGEQR